MVSNIVIVTNIVITYYNNYYEKKHPIETTIMPQIVW